MEVPSFAFGLKVTLKKSACGVKFGQDKGGNSIDDLSSAFPVMFETTSHGRPCLPEGRTTAPLPGQDKFTSQSSDPRLDHLNLSRDVSFLIVALAAILIGHSASKSTLHTYSQQLRA